MEPVSQPKSSSTKLEPPAEQVSSNERIITKPKIKKIKPVIFLSIPLIVLTAALLIHRVTRQQPTPTISQQTPVPSQAIPDLNAVPPLPSQFTWTKVDVTEMDNFYRQVLVTKEPNIYYEPITLSGGMWTTNLTKVPSEAFKPHEDLEQYYFFKLKAAKWDINIESDDFKLTGQDSGGGLGGSSGYVGINQDKVRVVNVGYTVLSFDETTLIRDARYWVFVSDIVPVAEIIQQAEKNN